MFFTDDFIGVSDSKESMQKLINAAGPEEAKINCPCRLNILICNSLSHSTVVLCI